MRRSAEAPSRLPRSCLRELRGVARKAPCELAALSASGLVPFITFSPVKQVKSVPRSGTGVDMEPLGIPTADAAARRSLYVNEAAGARMPSHSAPRRKKRGVYGVGGSELTTCSIRQHTSAYFSIRQHTSAYVSVYGDGGRKLTTATSSAYTSSTPPLTAPSASGGLHSRLTLVALTLRSSMDVMPGNKEEIVSWRNDRIRQHTSAYVSIRQLPSACLAPTRA